MIDFSKPFSATNNYGINSQLRNEATEYKELFDYFERIGFIGQLYPTNKKDKTAKLIGLLVPVDVAHAQMKYKYECMEFSRAEFVDLLERNNVRVLRDVDHFVQMKKELQEKTRHLEILELLSESYESSKKPLIAA